MRDYTVTEFVTHIDKSLKDQIGTVSVVGEIGKCQLYPSGHLYFSIKDENSVISSVMWRSSVSGLGFKPEIGVKVRAVGYPSVYGKTGNLQLTVMKLEELGEGALQKKFLELQKKLEAEGLFSQERKRPLPFFPKAVGIVTSSKGAVIKDIEVKVRERLPSLSLILFDSKVQGEGAAQELADGVRALSTSGLVDVIIVARGGGSLEELFCFNDEKLVRAIFASPVPVVSGVGHETDFTLCDFVADARAPTPTAAAELVTPSRSVLLEKIKHLHEKLLEVRWFNEALQGVDLREEVLNRSIQLLLREKMNALSVFIEKVKFLEPTKILSLYKEKILNQERKICSFLELLTSEQKRKISTLSDKISKILTHERISALSSEVIINQERLFSFFMSGVVRKKNQLEHFETILSEGAPEKVLQRGYTMVTDKQGKITTFQSVSSNQEVTIKYKDGIVHSLVTSKES